MGRLSLKERQKHQQRIREKRDADWKKHLENVAERNKNNPRTKASRTRALTREMVKARKEGLKAGKTKSSGKKLTAKSTARAANVARHGEKAISRLEAKNKDFQKMKKGGMSKAAFIKKYPNSQTAKRAKGRR